MFKTKIHIFFKLSMVFISLPIFLFSQNDGITISINGSLYNRNHVLHDKIPKVKRIYMFQEISYDKKGISGGFNHARSVGWEKNEINQQFLFYIDQTTSLSIFAKYSFGNKLRYYVKPSFGILYTTVEIEDLYDPKVRINGPVTYKRKNFYYDLGFGIDWYFHQKFGLNAQLSISKIPIFSVGIILKPFQFFNNDD